MFDPGFNKGGNFFDLQFTPVSVGYRSDAADCRSHPIGLSLMLAAVGLASTCGQDTEKQRTDQMRLIMKVREASEKKIAIDKIEAFVGAKAAINTMHRVDFIAWSLVNIELDTKNSQVKELPSSFPAVYWMLKPKSDDWRIVGVIWTEKMEMKVFFGTVLEP